VGFVVVVVPAGAGAREAALLLALGGSLAHGSVLLTVLVSRVLVTVVDLALAAAGLAALWRHRRAHAADHGADTAAPDEAGG
jgi:glycosyltransferase 2 family protein